MTTFIREYSPQTLKSFQYHSSIIEQLIQYIDEPSIKKRILVHGEISSGKTTLLNCINNDVKDNYEILDLYTLHECNIEDFREQLLHFCKMISNKEKLIIVDDIEQFKSNFQHMISYIIETYDIHIIATCLQTIQVSHTLQKRLHNLYLPSFHIDHLNHLIHRIQKDKNILFKSQVDCQNILLQLSNYSIRMIYSNLEKLYYICDSEITEKEIYQICCILSHKHLLDFTQYCFKDKNKKKVCEHIYYILQYGYSVIDFLEQYLNFIKYHEIDYISEKETCSIIHIISKYIIIFHSVHENEMELYLFAYELMAIKEV